MEKVRNRIRVVLAEKELTNQWLADKMGVTTNTVSKWINNKMQPSLQKLFEISKVLKVDIRLLLEPTH